HQHASHTLLTTTPANNNVGGPASVLIHNRSYASPYDIVSVIPSPVTETYPSLSLIPRIVIPATSEHLFIDYRPQ
ncbi:hypothetical protein APS60_11750, partial [Cutibacterium acnes]